jgi:transcriptional regulator with XRE-family HTH domain
MSGRAERQTFGANLRAARLAAGLSQAELCERLGGVSRTVVYRLEIDEREPRLSTILRLAEALDVEPSDLLDNLNA